MKTQQKISGYLQFTRKDRIALLVIALILLTSFLLPAVIERRTASNPPSTDTAWMSALRKLEKPGPGKDRKDDYKSKNGNKTGENYARDRAADRYNNGAEAELFSFDPNTLDDAGWKRLGVRDKTIGTIRKYLGKGGNFRHAEDLRKIYGLRPEEVERLIPYIRISDPGSGARPSPSRSQAHSSPPNTEARERFPISHTIRPVDINTADSLAFESLPGIGPTLASRIIRFREKLGGFYDVSQVRETFGISDSTFAMISPYLSVTGNHLLQKIDINSVDLNSLRKHPYIKYNIAVAIINYRTQHGPFATAEKLKQLSAIDDVLYQKLVPYLRFQ